MSREIKFRGITFKGDFVYGDLTNDATGLSFNESQWIRQNLTENVGEEHPTAYWKDTTKRIHWKEGSAFCNAPVKPETVGQFTGLMDKSGVEIYEGDILAAKLFPHYVERISWEGKPDIIGEVYWDLSSYGLVLRNGVDKRYSHLSAYEDINYDQSEVIGNIYQNPELLKEQS